MVKRKLVAVGIGVLLIAGTGYGVYAKEVAAKEKASLVQWASVERGDVTETVSASGTVQTPEQIKMSFSGSSGRLTSITAKVGEQVKAGQVLATVDSLAVKAQVANAQANVISAQAKLAQARQGATAEAIAVQQASVDKAKTAWDGTKQAYENQWVLYNDRTAAQQAVTNAQNQLDNAKIQVQSAQAGLEGANAKLAAAQKGPSDADVNAARTSVDVAQEQLDNARDQLNTAENQLDYAYATATSANNASNSTSLDVQKQIDQAQSVLNQARSAYNQARANLANAQKQLDNLEAGPDVNVVAQMQAAVKQSQAALDQAQAAYNAAQQNLSYAKQNYENRAQAKAQLDSVKNNVDQAEAAYQSALAQLNQVQAPPDSNTILAAQAVVAQAQAQLQQQQAALNNYTLTSPIDAIVTQVNGKVGEIPSASNPVVILNDANTHNLQVMAQVSQTDVGKLQSGQKAEFSSSAYPDKTFNGKVLMIYPEATTQNGVTSYNVLLSVDNNEGLLKAGMTTNVTIITGVHNNVLFVPAQVLKEVNGQDGVYVSDSNDAATNGGAKQNKNTSSTASTNANVTFRPITTGLFSSDRVEITSGLSEGDKVAMSLPSSADKKATGGFSLGGGSSKAMGGLSAKGGK
ncbi:efflux RND transporter periplasmic adaptor subunit [Heliobacterium chlorum]|uniref:Efflux RND transporter periplasmic adaptor subunit n=1 Tax=Heliobacterium chlorum TaxID=2698 RepID=A0ABR7T317_HELCL|nr:efflux RND transporter periplasmic adaptor subunit [Heliobacterium chlorum]MBC9784740.1 efflux RND transporter periplasmic adaptor subunit [Heliobacterium chlorum]